MLYLKYSVLYLVELYNSTTKSLLEIFVIGISLLMQCGLVWSGMVFGCGGVVLVLYVCFLSKLMNLNFSRSRLGVLFFGKINHYTHSMSLSSLQLHFLWSRIAINYPFNLMYYYSIHQTLISLFAFICIVEDKQVSVSFVIIKDLRNSCSQEVAFH